ncbi:MAG TPA: VWA domain-containing protein [Acidobacteriaceae bacterium]
MRRCFVALSALFVASTVLAAGQQKTPGTHGSTPSPAAVLHAGTQLVIVDVVVEDRNGHPVHDLTRDSFNVTEQKQPQTIRNFEEHRSSKPDQAGQTLPPLPPGVFTDYTPVPPDGTLNILLLDALNTPMLSSMFVQKQLLEYVEHERPGTRIAIFGLNQKLYMLQGFTSDPEVLKNVVEHLKPGSSSLLDDPTGSNTDQEKLSDAVAEAGGDAGTFAALKQMEQDAKNAKTQLRVRYTLDAFDAIAHYLANFPGHKNLIWFSGAFPLNILPDPNLNNPFDGVEDNNQEVRETTNLLAQAQVAVYPIDTNGLVTQPMLAASQSGRQYLGNPSVFNADLVKFGSDQDATHMSLEAMAGGTGGRAFYNTNGLADSVSKAMDADSNYYTLTYNPTDHKQDGAFRKIHVGLTGAAKTQGLHLAYRQGYFADDPAHPDKHQDPVTASQPSGAPPVDHAAVAYREAALSRGAPTPEDILFKVRVAPVSASTEDTVAPGNVPDAGGKMKGPYRRYAIDYAAVTRDFSLTLQPDGRRKGEMSFAALVYDSDGNLLNQASKGIALDISPETYKHLGPGARAHLEVSAPARQPSFLRLVVEDVPANRYGVVEIPTAKVSRLPPLAASAAP